MINNRRDKNQIKKEIQSELVLIEDGGEEMFAVSCDAAPLEEKINFVYFDNYYERSHKRGITGLSKEEARQQWINFIDLVNRWDPIGLIAMGCPEDEYECLLVHIMRLLEKGATLEQIEADMVFHLPDHFGVSVKNQGHEYIQSIVSLYFSRWTSTTSDTSRS